MGIKMWDGMPGDPDPEFPTWWGRFVLTVGLLLIFVGLLLAFKF
jgi:hypothetical protein